MSHKTAIQIYEIASFVLILAATGIVLLMKQSQPVLRIFLFAVCLVLAIFCRWMMERHRFKSCEQELDMAQQDIRRLTQLLAEEKKKNKQQ